MTHNPRSTWILVLVFGNLLHYRGLEAKTAKPRDIDDDLYDSPDIEIDSSLNNELFEPDYDGPKHPFPRKYSDDYFEQIEDSPDVYSNAFPIKKSTKSLPPLKKTEICTVDDYSPYCVCQKSCYPDFPVSITPCQCSRSSQGLPSATSSNSDTQQPPLLASQPSVPDYSSFYNQGQSFIDCSAGQNTEICSCQKACVPGIPLSYNPCTCMGYFDQNQPATPDFSSFNTMPQPDYSNLFNAAPQPSYNSYPTPVTQTLPHFDQNSCGRACLPYSVQQKYPTCLCNFNSKVDDNLEPFGPSMNPIGYDFPYQSFLNSWSLPGQPRVDNVPGNARRPSEEYLNANVPKVTRQPTSIGAYLGCYLDKKKPGRDLKLSVPVPKLTPDACINKCREKKKRFAAVQNGYLCFCGSRFGRYNRTKEENCGSPCTGDPKKYCGGHWLNAVYSTDGQLYSPKQFSFRTKDPVDELVSENRGKKQKKNANKKKKSSHKKQGKPEKASKATTKAPHKTDRDSHSNKKLGKTTKEGAESRRTLNVKSAQPASRQTNLASASTPSRMAQLIALGSKKLATMSESKHRTKYNDDGYGKKRTKEKSTVKHGSKTIFHYPKQ